MIEAVIRWSVNNRFFVLLATAILVGVGVFALRNTPGVIMHSSLVIHSCNYYLKREVRVASCAHASLYIYTVAIIN